MKITEAIAKRRSVRRYKAGEVIPREHFKQILEAAMMAPSACNSRPWEFYVVSDRQTLNRLQKVMPYASMLSTASAAIVVYALPEVQKGGIPEGYWVVDCGACTENILLEAANLGYGTCWCGVYPKEKNIEGICSVLGTKGVPYSLIAIGVPDEDPAARGHYEASKVHFIE
ncbi:MAG: nitroreductase family protein [Candidatus Bruticola sp.]